MIIRDYTAQKLKRYGLVERRRRCLCITSTFKWGRETPYGVLDTRIIANTGLKPGVIHWPSPSDFFTFAGMFLTMDPLCEKYPWLSPYVYCGNNPVNRIDPTGMDWFTDKDGTYQFDPNLTKKNQSDILKEGQTYVGATHQVKNGKGNVIEDYRKDGSIIFSNETNAYNRMWSQATSKNVEESGYALKNGKFIVMPDYENETRGVDIAKYDYSISKEGVLSNKDGEKFTITGNVHTHQDPTGDATPSFYTGSGWGDVGHSKYMGGLPVIVIGHDGYIYGVYHIKGTDYGNIDFKSNGVTRSTLLNGSSKLTPWLNTYPVTPQKK